MEEKRKKELEGMLKAIQDLKEEYYIGTGDAFEYLKRVRNIYERPKKIAELINERLAKESSITYIASPERVVGLNSCLNRCLASSGIELPSALDYELLRHPRIYLSENFPNFKFFGYVDVFDIDVPVIGKMKRHLEKIVKEKGDKYIDGVIKELNFFSGKTVDYCAQAFFPFFEFANKENVQTNGDFGIEVISFIKEAYEKIKGKIREDMIDCCSDYVEILTRDLSVIDWQENLSEEGLKEMERGKLDFNFSFNIRLWDMVEKIKRDCIDHKLEYRRMILCLWLENRKVNNYEEAISSYKSELENFEMLTSRMPEKFAKEMTTRSRVVLEFLRPLLYSEKNFIEKFLRS